MKKRQTIILVITVSIIIMGYLTMLFLASQRTLPKRQAPVVPDRYVKARLVSYNSIISPVVATGRITSSQVVDVVSEASGKIEKGSIMFKKGQSFKKGDVLVKIYDDEAILALKAKKSRFMNSLALLLPDVKVDFPSQYDNYRAFFNNIELDKDLPELPKIANEKMKIYLAARNLLNDYFTIKGEELRIKRYVITAPFDGALLSVNQEVGSFAGIGARLAKIINTDKLELEVHVSDVKSQWINIGDKVNISVNGNLKALKGKVVRKSNFIDERTQSRSVYVKVLQGLDNIVLGQYMTATFEGKEIHNVMEIPRNSVFNHNQVFVVTDSTLHKKNINIIKQNNTSVVFNGLEEGIDVVIEPLIDARENTKVKILR